MCGVHEEHGSIFVIITECGNYSVSRFYIKKLIIKSYRNDHFYAEGGGGLKFASKKGEYVET